LYEELEGPSSIGPLSNFEYLWDNYWRNNIEERHIWYQERYHGL
jgi:hypothetical protein